MSRMADAAGAGGAAPALAAPADPIGLALDSIHDAIVLGLQTSPNVVSRACFE